MTRKNLWKTLLLFMFPVIIYSCTKTGAEGPAGPAGLAYEGSIAGYVSLYDQYGNLSTADLSGIGITLDSTGSTLATATTTASGYYIFSNRFTGSYTIMAQSPSVSPAFGFVQSPFQYLSDTLYKNISMSAQANFAPTSVSAVTNTALGVDSLTINIAADPGARDVIIFVGNSNSVSSTSYITAITVKINPNATVAYYVVPAAALYSAGFASGSMAYYAVYGEPVSDKSVYVNDQTGQNVYNALSTASIDASTLVP